MVFTSTDGKPLRLMLIEWVDSVRPEAEWRHLDDLPKLDIMRCQSVGWLVGDESGVIMLAPNLADYRTGENAQASGCIRIPTKSVIRQVFLREVK